MRNLNFYNAVTAIKQDFNWVRTCNPVTEMLKLIVYSRVGFIKEFQSPTAK